MLYLAVIYSTFLKFEELTEGFFTLVIDMINRWLTVELTVV